MAVEIIEVRPAKAWNSTLGRPKKPMRRSGFKPKTRPVASKTAPGRTKRIKVRVWSDKVADAHFSLKIRQRDGKCLFPGCSVTDIAKLQCSHYIGRRHSATRYYPENCITLCWLHHFKDKMLGFEYQKQRKEKHGYEGQYTLFMKNWLGEGGFAYLCQLENVIAKRSTIKLALQAELKALQKL